MSFNVTHQSMKFSDAQFTFNLAAGITSADEGKAVSIDTSAAYTVKLAADGDAIVGRLEKVEDRVVEGILVGTVARRIIGKFPIKTGETINIGDAVQGAGSGEVKALPASAAAADPVVAASHNMNNIVVALDGTSAVVHFNV